MATSSELARLIFACPVCFGGGDEAAGMVSGLTWGLYILLFCTFGILSGFAYAVVQMEKRKSAQDALNDQGI